MTKILLSLEVRSPPPPVCPAILDFSICLPPFSFIIHYFSSFARGGRKYNFNVGLKAQPTSQTYNFKSLKDKSSLTTHSAFFFAYFFLSAKEKSKFLSHKKRRGWDSNPRKVLPFTDFRDPHLKPLGHLSAVLI